MSTRATILFQDSPGGDPTARIYRHCDGYPEAVLPDLQRFFEAVEAQTKDHRYGDASYLAAKFVVWQARENAVSYERPSYKPVSHADARPLDFISLGILDKDPGDIEHSYSLVCDGRGPNGRPSVYHAEVSYRSDERNWRFVTEFSPEKTA